MEPLAQLLGADIYRFALVFTRTAAVMAMLPGIGENAIPTRVRVITALAVSVTLAPSIRGLPVVAPTEGPAAILALGYEFVIGTALGVCAKLMLAALQTAGSVVGQTIGLSNPFTMEVGGFEGSSIPAGMLVVTGTAAFLAADLHYLVLDALVRSYGSWPAGAPPDMGVLAERITRTVGASFHVGMGLASPFLIFAVVGNLILGLVNRVMPAMPVYFVGVPASLAAGLFMFAVAAGLMVGGALDAVADRVGMW